MHFDDRNIFVYDREREAKVTDPHIYSGSMNKSSTQGMLVSWRMDRCDPNGRGECLGRAYQTAIYNDSARFPLYMNVD